MWSSVDDVHTATADHNSTVKVCEIFQTFCLASGMAVNQSKTFILNQINNDNYGLTPIPDSGFKHIGIPINKYGHYFNDAEHLSKAASVAGKLKNLHLSIFGIKRLIHSYIFSSIS